MIGMLSMNNSKDLLYIKTDNLVEDARKIIDTARSQAVRSVDFSRVQMYWNLGKRIFEEEQQGKERADYGSYLIKNLAATLEQEYGSGFSERQLKFCRQFYKVYPIGNTLRSQFPADKPLKSDVAVPLSGELSGKTTGNHGEKFTEKFAENT